MTHLIRSGSLASVLAAILLQGPALCAAGATRYVNLNNSTPVSPYTNWLSAATNIQDAVDAAGAGDEVVVADGHYATGGRALYGLMTNRVVIDKAVTVRSLNGPLLTIIEGGAAPGFVNGDGAVRCVYVGTNAVLSGFTLTNGHTRVAGHDTIERCGGGAWCETSGTVSNCTLTGNSADNAGGGAYRGILNNCTLSGNSAQFFGGGANGAALNNCLLSSNAVSFFGGGGGSACTLSNCTLIGNSAGFGGGGGLDCALNNCTLTGNSAGHGGGAENSTLNNCTLTGNWASSGGGACQCTLNNCTLTGNSASGSGGGVTYATLNNCTLSGNSASFYGGGANYSVLNNCIAYYNLAPNGPNHYGSTFNYSCTTPLPPGPGNIAVEPLLASTSHLSAESPCIGRGSSAYTSGVDIDGESWLDPPCMGADQFVAGQATGGLTMAFTAAYTSVSAGFAVAFVAQTSGHLAASVWDFGDGVVVSNRPYASHAWAAPGLYEVRLTGYNADWPDGVSATVQVQVGVREVYYVNATNAAPLYPYINRQDAATSIQEAIDAGVQIGRLVLVADGAYGTAGRAVYGQMTNRVVVSEGVEVRSVNGPLVTQIEGAPVDGTTNGDGAIRCVYVGTNAVLIGFTLTNGHTRAAGDYAKEQSGGGVWCEPWGAVSNCTLTGNSAQRQGGGAYGGTLNRCTLSSNLAGDSSSGAGGGAYNVVLNDCTLTGNTAGYGGGTYSGTLNNCTLIGNSALWYGGGASGGTLNNSILTDNAAGYSGGGVYGGTLNNCTLSGNSAGNGGGGVYDGALNNCTLTGNWASDGGGAYGGTLNKCILSGNWSDRGGGASGGTLNNCILSGNWSYGGGGAYGGTLNNCILTDNAAGYGGGGVDGGTLKNCTLTGNSAGDSGGGVSGSTLNNSIVYYNSAPNGPNYYRSAFNYSCTAPMPTNGARNIAAAPLFVNTNDWGNLRLRFNSPCINSGNNAYLAESYLVDSLDLGGQPRVVSGTVDIGAYEFQGSGSLISYAWLQQYGLPTDGSADFADPDHDGMNNWQEWLAGTSPLDPISGLRILNVAPTTNGWTVTWQSATGIAYVLERSTNLAVAAGFSVIQDNITGQPGTTACTDTNAVGLGSLFYRVGVR